jgi:hypothetical protein
VDSNGWNMARRYKQANVELKNYDELRAQREQADWDHRVLAALVKLEHDGHPPTVDRLAVLLGSTCGIAAALKRLSAAGRVCRFEREIAVWSTLETK